MTRRSSNNRSEKGSPNRHSPRAMIAIAVLVAAVAGVLLILASMRSEPTAQPSGANSNRSLTGSDGRARQVSYEVVNSYPHDPSSFTQGLLWADGGFYESTGLYGQSKLRRLEFPSGKVLKEISLTPELFDEGLALVDRR